MAAFATTLLALAGIAKAGASYAGSQRNARAVRRQGWFEAGQLEENAHLADEQAADALRRGGEQASQSRGQTAQLLGTQRAALAAQGIEVSSGSAADVTGDTVELGEVDLVRIRANAMREAWGFRQQAESYREQAGFALKASKAAAHGHRMEGYTTLLGAAAEVGADVYDRYRGRGPKVSKRPKPIGTTYSGPTHG